MLISPLFQNNWSVTLFMLGKYPIFVASAGGSRFTDVDGNRYIDFCLGDTGSMTGMMVEW